MVALHQQKLPAEGGILVPQDVGYMFLAADILPLAALAPLAFGD
jgi:hypothetical protein